MSSSCISKQDGSVICRKADDPADYLFINTKYHDCKITVTDPATKTVEEFGVVSSDLAAHSSVFRALLEDKNNDPKKLKIDNISPDVFKLMLIFVYGGKLPDMDRATAAQLALGAMAYDVKKLVLKASKRLKPSSVEDVFPALIVVAHIDQPALLPQVKKIIQEQTDAVLKSEEFLELDQKCIDFIAAQEQLAVSEVDLWNSLVKWSENKAAKEDENRSLRDILKNTLQFIRFSTMNQNDIIKEVMPKKILSSGEVTDLLLAISTNVPWECPGMCKNYNQRELCDGSGNEITLQSNDAIHEIIIFTFDTSRHNNSNYYNLNIVESPDYQKFSALKITTSSSIKLQSITFESRSIAKEVDHVMYNMSCIITVYKSNSGFCKDTKVLQLGGVVFCSNKIEFPLKLRNGKFLVLEADCVYYVSIEFATEHPVYNITWYDEYGYDTDPPLNVFETEGMSITPLNNVHLKQITYRV